VSECIVFCDETTVRAVNRSHSIAYSKANAETIAEFKANLYTSNEHLLVHLSQRTGEGP